ncbi:MAG: helix-turn-helix domain-containing protein [Acidimicrobiia bacterium]
MARDATATRESLLATARRLFARDGIYQVPLKQVVQESGQRNASALHYHFGNRDALLYAIIGRTDAEIEAERAEMLAALEADDRLDDLPALVEALVVPFSRPLGTQEGREFLAIIAQMSSTFDQWDVEAVEVPSQAQRTFRAIEACLPDLAPAVRHERVTVFLGLTTEALARRARLIDAGGTPSLDHDEFVRNLVTMSVGALRALTVFSEERS